LRVLDNMERCIQPIVIYILDIKASWFVFVFIEKEYKSINKLSGFKLNNS